MVRVVGKSGQVMDLPEMIANGLLRSGTVRRVGEQPANDGPEVGIDGEQSSAEQPSPQALIEPPARSALKADWVTWAVANGAEHAYAAGLTKPQLIEEFGTEPDPSGDATSPDDSDGDGDEE